MRRISVTACLTALAVVGCLTAAPAARATTVSVGGPAPGVSATSTTQGFLGISTMLTQITDLAGPPADPDTPFDHLVEGLSPGASPLLRLGGVATDDAWWPIPGMKEKYLTQLTPRWATSVHAMLTAMGAKAILGVDLESDSERLASTEVTEFDRYIGPNLIDAFELGNEPEFWPIKLPANHPPHDYPFKIAHYGTVFSTIAAGLGDVPLAGPASGAPNWLSHLDTLLGDLPPHLKLVTMHAYPLKTCSRLAQVTAADFFTRAAIQGLAQTIHHDVRAAAAHGEPLRVDEFNGISCGGQPGVSDGFGEALWALNALPALWHAGVQGVNLQTVRDRGLPDGGGNHMISVARSGGGWRVSVQPEYYGLLAFAHATPAGSRLLHSSGRALAGLRQFATRAPDGTERVVLTNIGSTVRTVRVTATGTRGAGSVSLLSAASLNATAGTRLGGQTLSARTGRLAGRPHLTSVRRGAGGAYTVRVPAHSAAILTVMARPATGA